MTGGKTGHEIDGRTGGGTDGEVGTETGFEVGDKSGIGMAIGGEGGASGESVCAWGG